MRQRKITSAFHKAALSRKDISVSHISELWDCAPSSVYGRLNPYPGEGRNEKLGMDEGFELADMLRDYSPIIEAMAERGFHIVHSDDRQTALDERNCFQRVSESMAAVGMVADRINHALSNDGNFDVQELTEIFEAASGAFDTLNGIASSVRKRINIEEGEQALARRR